MPSVLLSDGLTGPQAPHTWGTTTLPTSKPVSLSLRGTSCQEEEVA